MTKAEIYTAVVQEALDSGWDMYGMDKIDWKVIGNTLHGHRRVKNTKILVRASHLLEPCRIKLDKNVLFDHDFAKALWGEEISDSTPYYMWQLKLMDMAITEDIDKYLWENI